MTAISVKNLQKVFKVNEKDPGIKGSIKALFKRKYKLVKAIDDISFSIDEGELVGFIGPNGAGKTTTLKCLSGLLYPDGGEVKVLNFIPFERKHEFLKQIALVMGQKNQLWWDLPAIETFELLKEIYEIPEKKYKKTFHELVEMMGVADVLKTQVRKLSLGQRMKCELIAALLHSPKILFLDEPTIGLDVVMQKKIREFIREYNQKFGATIILTSHYMEDVKQLCQRIIMINDGKIVFDGRLDEIIKKYADYKTITAVFDSHIPKEELRQIAKIKNIENSKASFIVPRAEVSLVASKLLKEFTIEDFSIEEPAIEDIIRDMFEEKG